jgi:hypothetical protein
VVEDFDQWTGESKYSINYLAYISNEDSDIIERNDSDQPYIEMNIYSGKQSLIVKRKYYTLLWAIDIIGNVFGMIGNFIKKPIKFITRKKIKLSTIEKNYKDTPLEQEVSL